MMTIGEFVAPLSKSTNRDKVLAAMYFRHHYDGVDSLTTDGVRDALKSARVTGWKTMNVADVLAKCGPEVDSPGDDGRRRLWRLTDTGKHYVRDLLELPANEPEIEHDVSAIRKLISGIQDATVTDYLEEAAVCLAVDALRAAIVFVWTGAIRTIHQQMLDKGKRQLNTALQKFDPKCRSVSRIDHFAYVKDRTALEAAQELGLFDKNERDTLIEALNLRNRCGHPGKYKPGVKKTSSFIEDVVSIVFSL